MYFVMIKKKKKSFSGFYAWFQQPENEKTLKTENQRKTTRTKANTKLQWV